MPTPWLIRQAGSSRQSRLFCFCYAGGSAVSFMPWQAVIDPTIEIMAVQLPGRGARMGELPYASIPALIKALAPEIAHRSDLPFAFFGHSLGGLLAFELARYCKLNYMAMPEHLFVSACNAPQHRNPPEGLHLLPDDAFIDKLRSYNGSPPEVLRHRELMEIMLPSIRSDFALVDGYRYRSTIPLTMPITVLAGTRDEHISPERIAGWSNETISTCCIRWFDGDHFFIHSHRDAVIECISAELAETLCA